MNIRQLQLPLALALALGASNAHALGLGQIEVKSGLNQPLVAEIPILSAGPGELDELEVRLASPEAFARVGLERPVGLTANLQMSVGRNSAGQPVIRVTTPARFDEPFLTFLLEADWGRGSLVREFSALVDPPYIAPAIIRPVAAPAVATAPAPAPAYVPPVAPPAAQVEALPEPAAADAVGQTETVPVPEDLPPEPVAAAPQPLAPEPAPLPEPEPLPPEPIAEQPAPPPEPVAPPEPESIAPEPLPEPEPVAAAPPPPEPPVPVAPAPVPEPMPASADSLAPVAQGQTLWSIASRVRPDSSVTINQVMLALQRSNPEAFIDGNINQLKRGAVLRIPARDDVASLDASEAAELVRAQASAWQTRRAPVPQPAESIAQAPAPARPAPAKASAIRPAAASGARLEIVPPSGDELAARAVQSGASGAGGGSELRAELTQTREDLSAREAEVAELRSQLSELEQQQADSQRLIEMQSSQMKALQDRLGQADAPGVPVSEPVEPAQAAPAAATAAAVAAPASAPARPWYLNPYFLGGGGLVLLGGLVLALRGRRTDSPIPVQPRRISDDDALQASLENTRALAAEADRDDEPAELYAEAMGDAAAHPDPTLARLEDAVQSRPDDLEAHIGLLRHHYAHGGREAYDLAAQAMRDRVRSTLDPRWREAVVMGVALSPGNPLFSQAGWNSPKFGDTGVLAVSADAPAAFAASTDVPDEPAEDAEDWADLASLADAEPLGETDMGDALGSAGLDELEEGSSTKLELARAYLDIGDVEGARGMLEEVLAEAGPAGRAEAERLLRELG